MNTSGQCCIYIYLLEITFLFLSMCSLSLFFSRCQNLSTVAHLNKAFINSVIRPIECAACLTYLLTLAVTCTVVRTSNAEKVKVPALLTNWEFAAVMHRHNCRFLSWELSLRHTLCPFSLCDSATASVALTADLIEKVVHYTSWLMIRLCTLVDLRQMIHRTIYVPCDGHGQCSSASQRPHPHSPGSPEWWSEWIPFGSIRCYYSGLDSFVWPLTFIGTCFWQSPKRNCRNTCHI